MTERTGLRSMTRGHDARAPQTVLRRTPHRATTPWLMSSGAAQGATSVMEMFCDRLPKAIPVTIDHTLDRARARDAIERLSRWSR